MVNNESRSGIRRRLKQLRRTYRLYVINRRTFEEKISFLLNPLNMILLFLAGLLVFGALIFGILAFTPLKRWIPGYPGEEMEKKGIAAIRKADSLEHELQLVKDQYDRLKLILRGEAPDSTNLAELRSGKKDEGIGAPAGGEEPQKMREGAQEQELATPDMKAADPHGHFFYSPVEGSVTSEFEMKTGHYGVDVTAPKDEPIKSTLGGTIVFAGWTTDWGYVIQVQHSDDLLSVYKHNSILLKKTGEKVRAGDAIAVIGNTGELSSGPHLHFEIWYDGIPLNPQEYVTF